MLVQVPRRLGGLLRGRARCVPCISLLACAFELTSSLCLPVSHHPPVSAYFYISPANGVLIYGELRPKSKFLGNSAATIMDGENRVILMNKPEDGEYSIRMPNMYARGILFGKLILELGDTSAVKNVKTGLSCDVEFKTKGFFSGTYNAIVGKVKTDAGTLGELDGFWSDSVTYKDIKVRSPSSISYPLMAC